MEVDQPQGSRRTEGSTQAGALPTAPAGDTAAEKEVSWILFMMEVKYNWIDFYLCS